MFRCGRKPMLRVTGFIIVVMIFAAFGVIALMKVLRSDGPDRGGRHRSLSFHPDGDEPALQDDYTQYRVGFNESPGAFIRQQRDAHNAPRDLSVSLAAKDGTWQRVSGTWDKFFVFSAFYERRGNRTVRIIGATQTNDYERVWCCLWYKGAIPAPTHAPRSKLGLCPSASDDAAAADEQPHSVSVLADIKVIDEDHNLTYSAVFVECPLGPYLPAPKAVSVVSSMHILPANLLVVRNQDANLQARNLTAVPATAQPPLTGAAANTLLSDSIALCIKPVHSHYNQALKMLEILELNSILGVQHFTLYIRKVGAQVSCVLRDYIERGVVTLLPWELNMVSGVEIDTDGILAALNDCIYRSMYRYKYTVLVDLDEYIIPRNQDTLQELVQWVNLYAQSAHSTGSYSFQNAFFYQKWDDDPAMADADRLESGLLTQSKTRRCTELNPQEERSKYLCRPETVVEAGVHFVREFAPGFAAFNVPTDAAILHHYRANTVDDYDCNETASVLDRTAHRYRERLSQRVRQRYREMQVPCALPHLVDDPLSPAPTPTSSDLPASDTSREPEE